MVQLVYCTIERQHVVFKESRQKEFNKISYWTAGVTTVALVIV